MTLKSKIIHFAAALVRREPLTAIHNLMEVESRSINRRQLERALDDAEERLRKIGCGLSDAVQEDGLQQTTNKLMLEKLMSVEKVPYQHTSPFILRNLSRQMMERSLRNLSKERLADIIQGQQPTEAEIHDLCRVAMSVRTLTET